MSDSLKTFVETSLQSAKAAIATLRLVEQQCRFGTNGTIAFTSLENALEMLEAIVANLDIDPTLVTGDSISEETMTLLILGGEDGQQKIADLDTVISGALARLRDDACSLTDSLTPSMQNRQKTRNAEELEVNLRFTAAQIVPTQCDAVQTLLTNTLAAVGMVRLAAIAQALENNADN